MDLNFVDKLIKMVNSSALESLELEQDGLKIKLVNSVTGRKPAPVVPVSNIVETNESAPAAVVVEQPSEDTASYKYITAPIVGIYRTLSSIKKGDDAVVGKKVSKGDSVCAIEAMKLINDVESNVDGEIVEILVNDGDQVEYAQNLFKVK